MILIGGYYRSGTTYIANLIAEKAGQLLLEPGSVGGFPWNRELQCSFFTEDLPNKNWPGLLRHDYPAAQVCKCTQGALRWGAYVEAFRRHWPGLKVVYVLRHPRGIVASHIFRRFPFGFDYHNLDQRLLRASRDGWPHNEDAGFFGELFACADQSGPTPLVTVAQWLAHVYDALIGSNVPQEQLVVRFDSVARWRSARMSLLRSLGLLGDCTSGSGDEWPSNYSAWGGWSGRHGSLQRESSIGCAADGALRLIRELAEKHGSTRVTELLKTAGIGGTGGN